MHDDFVIPDEEHCISLQNLEYANGLPGLGRPIVLVRLVSDQQKLTCLVKATEA